MSARGPTWAQLAAWCRRNGVDSARVRDDIERHAADEEARHWRDEMHRLSTEAGPHLTGAKWLENQRLFTEAQSKFNAAMKRAFPP